MGGVYWRALLLFSGIGVPIFAQEHPAARPRFEVASIKLDKDCPQKRPAFGPPAPGRLALGCMTVKNLIVTAYGALANGTGVDFKNNMDVTGGPAWMETEFYDINAKADGATPVAMMGGPMLQGLLEDRFQLKIHRETREGPVYLLTVAKGGPKFEAAKAGACEPVDLDHLPKPGEDKPPFCGIPKNMKPGPSPTLNFEVKSSTVADFVVGFLRPHLDRPVVDKTGLDGKYDMRIEFVPEGRRMAVQRDPGSGTASDPGGPGIFEAIKNQLGLILEKGKGPIDGLVVDRLEHPSDN